MSKAKISELGTKLGKLALVVTEQALAEGVSLEERLEALKIAGGYHVSVSKAKVKDEDKDPEASTFGNFRDRINGTKSAEREN